MKLNTRYYCCSAIDLLDWVYSFSVLYVAMCTSTGIFTQCPQYSICLWIVVSYDIGHVYLHKYTHEFHFTYMCSMFTLTHAHGMATYISIITTVLWQAMAII